MHWHRAEFAYLASVTAQSYWTEICGIHQYFHI